jgi:hypothetical protein
MPRLCHPAGLARRSRRHQLLALPLLLLCALVLPLLTRHEPRIGGVTLLAIGLGLGVSCLPFLSGCGENGGERGNGGTGSLAQGLNPLLCGIVLLALPAAVPPDLARLRILRPEASPR